MKQNSDTMAVMIPIKEDQVSVGEGVGMGAIGEGRGVAMDDETDVVDVSTDSVGAAVAVGIIMVS